MKLYVVEIKSTAVVQADNETQARLVAAREVERIVGGDLELSVQVATCIRTPADIPRGWAGDDVPYGGDRATNKTIAELLAP